MSELDSRYGRTPERTRRGRVIAVVSAALGAVLIATWAAWAGVLSPGPSLDVQTVGSEPIGDEAVLVRFQLSVTPGSTVSCAVEAQNAAHAIVGWKVVELPPAQEYTRFFEERVLTSEPPVVGLISECRLA